MSLGSEVFGFSGRLLKLCERVTEGFPCGRLDTDLWLCVLFVLHPEALHPEAENINPHTAFSCQDVVQGSLRGGLPLFFELRRRDLLPT